ncbi:isoprenylcysteine carboxylmethyltransferase family protein [Ralstonia solanacearum]|nr:isoprenylcysteine carboxyl methyltransferase [Ralstonia solanacearum]AMP74362.1 isoprenylcysteine carboxyl methyltransferase [Ralstonia solanacearum]MBB6585833.1 isoprenylcysteine carboxylmethyltransferase family protein [Ralstonia solanacearum]OAI75160.1 isoprenylcysteine carboxyl methyltransferase [Ralstonia solanacearum]QJC24889.1 isoprenylcysteine carboxylmethyltransferase family protein [Ralstonia solanacearum]
MRRSVAAAVSLVFFAIAPGVVAGLVPWWLTHWRAQRPLSEFVVARGLGVVLLIGGTVVLIAAFMRFVTEGAGTPAPVAPPEHLVVGGLYRYVRNPMYLAVEATIVGQALLLWQPALLLYAAAVWATMALFVRTYEEPALRRKFGTQYEAYRDAVPAWWPRLRPWKPGGDRE